MTVALSDSPAVIDRRYSTAMDLERFREYCLKKCGVTEGMPFGPDVLVLKVGGKIFALASLEQVPTTVNLKCDPDRALELRDRYEQVRPGYHMNKKHWNTVEIGSGVPESVLLEMIDHSYDLVVSRLPKSVAAVDLSRRSALPVRLGPKADDRGVKRSRSVATKASAARRRRFPIARHRARH